MEVSALKYSGAVGLHGRGSLLRLQSDDRLIAFIRRGNHAAFEILVGRYEARLLAFCRHMLASREDAEDVLQEVFAAAFNAILADARPINVRPWLYRIARNRSLNHLRRIQAVGVDSMDVHFSDNGASTADKVHNREEFRLLVGDIQGLPETQRTALLLREMDALSYEQIAEAMETTVPSVKSLLVRARVSLAEASEARLLSCDEVRIQLGELAEGLRRRPSPLVRRHLRACDRCSTFKVQLRETNKALTALLPIGPFVLLKQLAAAHVGHSAGAGSSATAVGSGVSAAGSAAAAGSTVTTGGILSAGLGAVATKAAAGLAAAALVTAGAVEVGHVTSHRSAPTSASVGHVVPAARPALTTSITTGVVHRVARDVVVKAKQATAKVAPLKHQTLLVAAATSTATAVQKTPTPMPAAVAAPPGRTVGQTLTTIIQPVGTLPTGSAPTGAGTIVPTTPPPAPITGASMTGTTSTTGTAATTTPQSTTVGTPPTGQPATAPSAPAPEATPTPATTAPGPAPSTPPTG